METTELEARFPEINGRIDELCKFYAASGSNGRTESLLRAIRNFLAGLGIQDKAYWDFVALHTLRPKDAKRDLWKEATA